MAGPVVPVVIDTNILVPTLYRKTPILKFVLDNNIVILWNHFIRNEAVSIIYKLHKLRAYQDINVESVLELLDLILDSEDMVSEMPESWPQNSPDRKDDPFLYVAYTFGAEYIITNDKQHLLKLKQFNGIPIGTPRSFFYWAKHHHPLQA